MTLTGAMDPIGAAAALTLTASAFYRTTAGKREALTAGLWAAAFGLGVGAFVVPVDAALKDATGLDSLSQLITYIAMVISSYLIAQMTYRVARIESYWPLVFTVTSMTGMVAFYCATDLHHVQTLAIEAVPGAASAWFAIFYAVGLLPTHIAAIIGVLGARHKDNLMVWLLAIYGGVGALNPVLIVVDHIGTHTVRWPLAFLYPFVWVIQLISFGALSVTGAISTHRAKLLAVA
jgi:hypothetical protein